MEGFARVLVGPSPLKSTQASEEKLRGAHLDFEKPG